MSNQRSSPDQCLPCKHKNIDGKICGARALNWSARLRFWVCNEHWPSETESSPKKRVVKRIPVYPEALRGLDEWIQRRESYRRINWENDLNASLATPYRSVRRASGSSKKR